jgi:hypothetical protein
VAELSGAGDEVTDIEARHDSDEGQMQLQRSGAATGPEPLVEGNLHTLLAIRRSEKFS